MTDILIDAPTLEQALASGSDWRVFDVSFELGDPRQGRLQYLAAHIPSATHADLDQHLCLPVGPDGRRDPSLGRHPLPEREILAAWLGTQGVGDSTTVVAYDRQGSIFASRLWWMLRWCGHDRVRVLDGGLRAWTTHGGHVEVGEPPQGPHGRAFTLRPSLVPLRNTADVAQQLGRPTQTLLDARAVARFRGDTEPLDPVAGHIPGALNRPFGENFDADGKFLPAVQLREAFDAQLAGRDPRHVVHHCGSGVSAIPNLMAMELAGLHGSALYAGSWSAWCNTPDLPCARGA